MEQIKSIAKHFTVNSLGKVPPSGLCFTVALPLHLHLLNHKIECRLLHCKCEGRDHFYIRLKDYESMIVDPTYTQFDFSRDIVPQYVYEKPSEFIESPSENEWFSQVYDSWIELFRNPSHYTGDPCFIDINSRYEVNLRAAALLINRMVELNIDILSSEELKQYFSAIFEVISTLKVEIYDKLSTKDAYRKLIQIYERNKHGF